MFIDKIETNFTNVITIGKYANFIYTKKGGVFISPDEIYERCIGFSNVIILGEDPLLQREEVGKLCRKLVKNNPNIKIEVHTTGTYRPLEVNQYKDNVVFNVYLNLDATKLKEESITFYIEFNLNFIFDMQKEEDIDTTIMICNAFGIKKSQVFLTTLTNINLQQYAKINGFNISPVIEW